jgi:predicted GTPase
MQNVILFGETGGGKSSAMNLLLGRKAANVSDSAIGCTFDFSKHSAQDYTLFDTVGLSEGHMGTVKQTEAVRKLVKLLRSLEEGVSLLVFVMEKGRIKKTLEENYKLFVDVMCMKKVPVVLLVTHCEGEKIIGTWWNENKGHFEKYGMRFAQVVSGCCWDPEDVPEYMKEAIRDLNATTKNQLHSAIMNNMLRPGWRVEGGWQSWIFTIIAGVMNVLKRIGDSILQVMTLGLFKPGPDVSFPDALRNRVYKYLRDSGHPDETARAMAEDIANAINA